MILDFDRLPRFKPEAYKIIKLIPAWAHGYNVDEEAIIRQIPLAHAWCDSNPKEAPKKLVTRFLFNWMSRAKKFGNLVTKPKDLSYKENRPAEEELMTEEDFKKMREAIRK